MLYIIQNSPKVVQYIVTELILNPRFHFEMYKRTKENKINIYFIIIIFINCNWVVTRWQYTLTHKNNIEQHN